MYYIIQVEEVVETEYGTEAINVFDVFTFYNQYSAIDYVKENYNSLISEYKKEFDNKNNSAEIIIGVYNDNFEITNVIEF